MKQLLFFFFFLMVNMMLHAQLPYDSLQKNEQIKIILTPVQAVTKLPVFFSGVRILDARQDTSEVGFYATGALNNKWPKLYKLLPSATGAIATWVKDYLGISVQNETSQSTLLIVIKDLWLSEEAVPASDDNGKQLQPKLLGFDPGLVTNLEFYLEQNDIYYPMYKIDSVFTYDKDLFDFAGIYITESLKQSLVKLYNIDFAAVLARGRKLSIADIKKNITEKVDLPILTATTYQEGVYKDFEEFRNNAPSLKKFELRKGELGDLLYVTENGSSYPLRNAWGYCDGKDLYINSADIYWKLIKRQNSFYFAGIKGITKKARHNFMETTALNLINNTGRKHTKFTKIIKYYKLDIEYGEVY